MDKKFIKTVSAILKVPPEKLTEKSTVQSIPEWDSLNHWSIIGMLEDTYGIEFTMDEAMDFKNLGDIYNTLVKKCKTEK